ncbi:MAG: HAMP domain-containing histidine kinase [Coriobacteriia bacterium]|nr:HAMP domain-containing histidine kinase [Coriobacteriia bacterium]
MMRSGLFWRIFLGTLTVGLGSVLTVGLVTRTVFTRAFSAYVQTLPGPRGMGMMGGGRTAVVGAAEQAFLTSVDRGVLLGGLVAAAVAAVAAFLLARALTDPLRRLEDGAALLAAGDLAHRVEVGGPGEIVALGQSFNAMADSLQHAEELRRRMVADVAHELRNPLAAARVQAEGMAEGVLPTETARLESLVDDLTHLSRIVDDLQELALAEAGRLAYEMEPLDVVALAAGEASRAAALAAPGVVVRPLTGDSPVQVIGDEGRLSQVMRNLLVNAVRHTQTGHIEVTVGTQGGLAEVRVSDTGEGISAEDLPHVFERFWRADSARASATGGAGLGLSISRRIIEDHGGEVFAESEPSTGTTVGFRLPLAT